jgi:hypothetical protein
MLDYTKEQLNFLSLKKYDKPYGQLTFIEYALLLN